MPLEISFEPCEAATLLMPSGPSLHLFVIVTRPCPDFYITLVNIDTVYPNKFYDSTCVLGVGDHPFINRPSWVNYRNAKRQYVPALKHGVAARKFIPRPQMHSSAFERVCDGFLASPHVRPSVKSYVQAQFARM